MGVEIVFVTFFILLKVYYTILYTVTGYILSQYYYIHMRACIVCVAVAYLNLGIVYATVGMKVEAENVSLSLLVVEI